MGMDIRPDVLFEFPSFKSSTKRYRKNSFFTNMRWAWRDKKFFRIPFSPGENAEFSPKTNLWLNRIWVMLMDFNLLMISPA
jgi:hypothetical protein